MDLKSKIILIYGPTASGKSLFAIKLAKKINGEIINADSMQVYKELKILVREVTKEDIKSRNLPNQTSGLVITKINNDSPLFNSVEVNSIILEAQKKKIKTINDLDQAVKKVLGSNQKTMLLVIYNIENSREYIGVNLE